MYYIQGANAHLPPAPGANDLGSPLVKSWRPVGRLLEGLYLGMLLRKQACFRISWKALRSLAEWSRQRNFAMLGSLKIINLGSQGVLEGLKSVPRGLLNPSWSLFTSWRPLELLLEASWSALGGLRGQKEVLLDGSWPVLDDFQDRFQPSWGPKGSRKAGQEGQKSSPRGGPS